jgi:hypothetical protein
MYINILVDANSSSDKLWTKENAATAGKLITAVYGAYGYVYIYCTG